MFITIIEVNGKEYKTNKKEVRKGIFIPDCFKDEEQYDRWFNETLFSGKYRRYHLRENNVPEIQEFEGMKLKLKFS